VRAGGGIGVTNGIVRVLELRSACGAGGGPEKTILLGAERADPRVAVTVCYIRDARDRAFSVGDRARQYGVDYVEVTEDGSFDRRVWTSLRGIIRTRGIHIVHAHDYKTDLLALMLARVERIVPLATAHGWTGHSRRERLVYYPLDKRMLRAFPVTIAVSGEIKSELVRHGAAADRVRVVLNGIDQRAFRRDRAVEKRIRAEMALLPDDIVVGSIGRLEPQKRFDLLIEACASLRGRFPRLRLLIAGEGSLRRELKELALRRLPPPACVLLGHRADVANLHHAFDLYVQSSDYEGTPNSVLEAMALETPIVATDAGGTSDILRPDIDGLVVPCGDAGVIAAAMERALAQPGPAAARVRSAHRRVETTLSFDRRMAAVERIYMELAGRLTGPAEPAIEEECA
jgi:glycosyltransferase involved in cell wall biosynthesis